MTDVRSLYQEICEEQAAEARPEMNGHVQHKHNTRLRVKNKVICNKTLTLTLTIIPLKVKVREIFT